MRDRGAEDGHDRVADELLDRAAVAFDLLAQARVVGADARADVLNGSALSERAVNPTRSQKRTVTTLRSSSERFGSVSISGAVQKPQNSKPAGFSLPQLGQVAIR